MKNLIRISILGGALLAAGCGKSASEATATTARAIPVRVVPVVYSERAVPVRATGLLSRKTEAELAFKVGGVIEAVHVRAGDTVTAGQVLAELRLDEIEAQVAQARSGLEKARRDLVRVEKLESNRVATLENLQDARTAVEVADAQLRIAEFNRRYAVIVAPSAGRILTRLAEPSELVGAGKAVLGFASEDDGWLVRVGLADRDVARVRVGDRAEMVGTDGAVGEVAHVSEATDPATRTTPVEIALGAGLKDGWRSGSVVTVVLQPAPVEPRPVVPTAVLIEGKERKASLYLVEKDTTVARRVVVECETLTETEAYLRTPLPRDARVVVQGGEYLHDGAAVEIVP